MLNSQKGPLPCHWYENPDTPGERFLVPCCAERLDDAEAACSCELPVEELRRLRARVGELAGRLSAARWRLMSLTSAVGAHPDGAEIFERAQWLEDQQRGGRR